MAAYVAGDASAFREIFRRYGPVLQGMLRRKVGHEADAQDLLQQTFLQFHRARFDFAPGNLVRPWLITIALNLGRELGRKRRIRRETPLEADPACAPSVSQPLDAREDRERVRAALLRLPESHREVIELHWFQGLPFSQVSSILGASINAVKVRAHRGYERLRDLLGETRQGSVSGRAREESADGLS
ncbi:RNA polymerase sigma factor [bacterium]|nr:RNA polymerase sigma factor [bacterium]